MFGILMAIYFVNLTTKQPTIYPNNHHPVTTNIRISSSADSVQLPIRRSSIKRINQLANSTSRQYPLHLSLRRLKKHIANNTTVITSIHSTSTAPASATSNIKGIEPAAESLTPPSTTEFAAVAFLPSSHSHTSLRYPPYNVGTQSSTRNFRVPRL